MSRAGRGPAAILDRLAVLQRGVEGPLLHRAHGFPVEPPRRVGAGDAYLADPAVGADDEIEFDLLKGTIAVKADLDARKTEPVEISHPFGYLADFAATVSQAHEGCVPKWTLNRTF